MLNDPTFSDSNLFLQNTVIDQKYSNVHGPSRFDMAEIEELNLGVFSSFDDITYNTKPIIQANNKKIDSETIDTSSEVNPNIVHKISENSELIEKKYVRSDTLINDWEESESSSHCEDILSTVKNKVLKCSNKKEKSMKSKLQYTKLSCKNDVDQNHTKIVKEVLKKYPYLMQQNKNIKLKVLKKESKNAEHLLPGKKKFSCIVLKSDSLLNNDLNKFESRNDVVADQETKINEFGPWKCSKCNLNEHYSDYHSYRIHMQDVHGEKFDPRICEYCGFKTSKRNTLMYHLYTKHNISPPRSLTFPKCQECSYVALSKSFLNKHQINHKHYSADSFAENFEIDSIPSCSKKLGTVSLKHDQVLQIYEDSVNHGSSIPKHCKIRLDVSNTTVNASLVNAENHLKKLSANDDKLEQLVKLPSVFYNKKNTNLFNLNHEKIDLCSDNVNSKLRWKPEIEDTISIIDDEIHSHHNRLQNDYLSSANREENNDPECGIQTTNNNDTVPKKKKKVIQNANKVLNFPGTFDDFEKIVIEEQHEIFDEFSLTNHSERKKKLSHKKKEVRTSEEKREKINQYVEEETEILEYQTCNYN